MEDDETGVDEVVKIILCGDASVGKTNLLLRFSKDVFDESQKSTIGMDFVTKDVVLEDKKLKVQFWDTAGQEKFRSMSNNYYRAADGLLFVYDITKNSTFDRLSELLRDTDQHATKGVSRMLIGNKTDLEPERQVTQDRGARFAEKHKMFFFETSAKNNHDQCVNKSFDAMIAETYRSKRANLESASKGR